MGSISGGNSYADTKGKSQSQSTVNMPDWLQPFVQQSTGTASSALQRLQQLSGQDTVADLTDEQLAGLDAMRGLVGSDFYTTAQNTFMNAAQGQGTGFMDPALVRQLSGEDFDLNSFVNQMRDATGFTNNQIAQDALERTAAGDYLYGGDAFDAALQASINSALPQVASAFGGSVGGVGSGLASTAVNQAALDAFASQYGQERARQLGAAESLQNAGISDRAAYMNAANNQMNRNLAGQEILAGISDSERQRQMAAAAALPDIGMLDANTQMQIGEYLQNQQQNEMNAPLQNQLQLLMAALQGPGSYAPYLGQDSWERFRNKGWDAWVEGSYTFSSDRRLKENIKYIGEMVGRKFYTWTWKPIAETLGLDGPTVGIMAQENPDVSFRGDHGYLMVDYDAVFGEK